MHEDLPSLTQRDFPQNLAFLVDRIRRTAPELWNSFYEGDLGTVLLDVIAFDSTLLTYTSDVQFRECFLETLQQYESLRHFCRQTGYQLRRNSAASVEALLSSSAAPPVDSREYILVRRGTKVYSKDGTPWEVAEDIRIEPGKYTPARTIIKFGDIVARTGTSGEETEVEALVTIRRGESAAILTDRSGNRLPSNYNFSQMAGPGQILRLTSQGRFVSVGVGTPPRWEFRSAPDITRAEFVVVGTGKLEFDKHDHSILYLDRAWDLDTYTGKWELESRSVTLVQGESKEDRITVPDLSESDRKGYTIKSSLWPVLSGAAESYVVSGLLSPPENRSGITVQVNGTAWRETASLLFSGPQDQVYQVDFDHLDRAMIRFGNGTHGALVPASASLIIQYRIGGGVVGNVAQGSFDTTVPGITVPASGNNPTLFLSNPYTVGAGGRDRESIQEARENISSFVRTNDRAVTAQDYAYLASNFTDPRAGRVAHAIGVLHQNAAPRESNVVWVYTWADRGTGELGEPSLALKQALLLYLNERKMVTDEVVIVNGVSTRVPVVFQYRYSRTRERWQMEEAIRSGVAGVFAKQKPGQELLLSRLYEATEAIEGLDMVLMGSPITNYVPASRFELFVNSTTEPHLTRLLTPVLAGAVSIPVENPALFYPGGIVTVWEPGRTPTVSEVESVNGSVLTLKRHTPLRDSYNIVDPAGRGAEVYNTDYIGYGWQFEREVKVHVRYDTDFGTVEEIDRQIAFRIRQWFQHTLKPETALSRSSIEYLVRTTSGVTSHTVGLGSVDGTVESIQASVRERIVLGHLSINGVTC